MKNSSYNELPAADKKLYNEAVKLASQPPYDSVLGALRIMQESATGIKWIALHNLIVDEINE